MGASFFPVHINFRGLTFLLGVTRSDFSITFHGIAAVKFILTGNYSSECDYAESLIYMRVLAVATLPAAARKSAFWFSLP